MALTSPGVEVTVIDESFYTPAEPGTTPLIVVATAQDKTNAAGTGVAAATTAANAGNAFKVTSQKELVDLFGVPNFEKTASNTPIHGSELNEYGLLAAYSLLGVSNAAFIVRADVDLNELSGSADAPGANPDDGTWWINTGQTSYGIQEWNSAAISTTGGQKFGAKIPTVLTNADASKISNNAPKASVGSIGDYAVVFETVGTDATFSASKDPARIYYKSAGNTAAGVAAGDWVLVGSQEWRASHPTIVTAQLDAPTITAAAGNFTLNGTLVTIGASDTVDEIVSNINGLGITGVTAKNVNSTIYIYTDGTSNSNANTITIVAGTGDLDELEIQAATYKGPELQQTPHTSVPQWKGTPGVDADARPTGSIWIKTTEPNNGARWRASKWSSAIASWESVDAPIYANGHNALYYLDRSGGGENLAVDTLFVQSNANEHSAYDASPATATFRVWRRAATGQTVITSAEIATQLSGVYNFEIEESIVGQLALNSPVRITFTASGATSDATTMAAAINAAGLTNIEASVTDDNKVQIVHKAGGDFRLRDVGKDAVETLFTPYNIDTGTGGANFYNLSDGGYSGGQTQLAAGADDSTAENRYLASNWQPLSAQDFYASPDAPENEPDDGQLWYNPEFSEVDIMYHNGTTWVGYQYDGTDPALGSTAAFVNSDPEGPQVAATAPTTQSDGSALVSGDLWISTADLENFPTIYKWDANLLEWVLVDKTDQTTEDGILFADARYGSSGATGNTAATIKDLLTSNYLDPDAPDPALYPQGMLLWNLRRSGGNVKKYNNNYIDTTADNTRFKDQSMSGYATDRWSTESGNQEDGSGSFGRKAQRMVVVQSLKSVIDTSSQIRDEERRNFNIIAAPGYTEVMSNLVNLNIDRGLTAFVIGDTPLRLAADATTLTNYGTNANLVTDNSDDGLVTYDEYLGAFYPNGFTTDLGGANAVVPASHMMMRTIALSDQVSFPWFAPAGTRRGGISNATAVGYIDAATGEFQTVALNEGQRDTLYDLKINPITFFNGVGLVNYGQKTRARNASALDRINVARLVVYLRSQLNKLARPYIFEPNDKITRDEIKQSVESLLLELVGLRAIYDFAVVCDETNNTPARIDRNELYVDIAIEPVKAIEFIYIPLRVKNTGEI